MNASCAIANRTAPWLLLALGLALTAGCSGSTYVYVKQDAYSPQLPDNLNVYRGAAVHLASFTNRAENTSMFYYYSPDYSVTYEGAPSLQSYLWYCFEKALLSLGMKVYSGEDNPPVEVPEVQLTFTSLTDQEFKFEVVVLKGNQQIFKNSYAIAAPPPKQQKPAALEQRAYRMVDAAVSAVLSDPAFQQSLY